ncbi:hypothetical protein [Kitasatospora sp. NPDC127116]
MVTVLLVLLCLVLPWLAVLIKDGPSIKVSGRSSFSCAATYPASSTASTR